MAICKEIERGRVVILLVQLFWDSLGRGTLRKEWSFEVLRIPSRRRERGRKKADLSFDSVLRSGSNRNESINYSLGDEDITAKGEVSLVYSMHRHVVYRTIASCNARNYNNNGLEWKLVTNELSRPNTEPFPLPATTTCTSSIPCMHRVSI